MTESPSSPLTSRVLLRDVQEGDLPTLFEHQWDPAANEMAAFPARDRAAFMAHWAKILVDETVIRKTILFDGCVVGHVVSFDGHGGRLVGYWIGREHWGRGIASQALQEFLIQAPQRPLIAYVVKHNLASIRVLRKCGFVVRGEGKGLSQAPGEEVEEFVFVLQ